jgi:hypothetical protein
LKSPSDEIFHLNGDQLISMPSRSMREGLLGKSLEDALQTFLEKYPQIIPGKQIDPVSDDPPHFVLLRREMPVGGWSLDHLYVDQRSILTLVETKLFQNPESRREVIGQIIEYAANAIEYWAEGAARQKAIEFWSSQNPPRDVDELLQEEFGADAELDTEEFWRSVEENLKKGKIRLIIAADELRPEMRRMLEYLNREMQNAEVLGLELKCYGKDSASLVLVPRLIGQTQSLIDKKGPSAMSLKWTSEKLSIAINDIEDITLKLRLRKLLDWAINNGIFIESRTITPSFGLRMKSSNYRISSFWTNGSILCFLNENQFLKGSPERDEFVSGLKELNLLPAELDASKVNSSRYAKKTIQALSEGDFDALIHLFSKYCI